MPKELKVKNDDDEDYAEHDDDADNNTLLVHPERTEANQSAFACNEPESREAGVILTVESSSQSSPTICQYSDQQC